MSEWDELPETDFSADPAARAPRYDACARAGHQHSARWAMCDFQPGDLVECVDARPLTHPLVRGQTPYVLGAVYTVETARLSFVKRRPILDLVGLPLPIWSRTGRPLGHQADRFRRVLRPDPDFLAKLLSEPAPPELEVA